MAEIEISVLGGRCLKRRIGSKEVLERETAAYVSARNAKQAKVLWEKISLLERGGAYFTTRCN